MRVFIAMSIENLSDEEISQNIETACENIGKIFSHDLSDTVECNHLYLPIYKEASPLCQLGASIQNIDYADAVYFYHGWENDTYCRLLHKICEEYGIQRVDA